MLTIASLVAGYGTKMVVNNVSLTAKSGEVTAIVGANGSGKSTVLKAVMGLCDVGAGELISDGKRVDTRTPVEERVVTFGFVFVPQVRSVFQELTVEENLRVSLAGAGGRAETRRAIECALESFNLLQPRRRQSASTLSGGERQTLALAMALARPARAILLDEPTNGLASDRAAAVLTAISHRARDRNLPIIIVEHGLQQLRRIVEQVYILRRGTMSYAGSADILDAGDLAEYFL